jgi:glycosyltransferase involved in cell wall biosynthesis
LANQLGIGNVVEFTGFRADIRQAISELGVVVHASTIGEPFGQVIIEGMAAGKPVVATNGGGVPEIVQDGKTGILVPMGDASAMAEAICRICADPILARTMGSSGKQRVAEHFTIEQTARKVESVYAILG